MFFKVNQLYMLDFPRNQIARVHQCLRCCAVFHPPIPVRHPRWASWTWSYLELHMGPQIIRRLVASFGRSVGWLGGCWSVLTNSSICFNSKLMLINYIEPHETVHDHILGRWRWERLYASRPLRVEQNFWRVILRRAEDLQAISAATWSEQIVGWWRGRWMVKDQVFCINERLINGELIVNWYVIIG